MRKKRREAIQQRQQREKEAIMASFPPDYREWLEKSMERDRPEMEAGLERHRKKYERFEISQRVEDLNSYIKVISMTSILTCTYFML